MVKNVAEGTTVQKGLVSPMTPTKAQPAAPAVCVYYLHDQHANFTMLKTCTTSRGTLLRQIKYVNVIVTSKYREKGFQFWKNII